MAKKRKQKKESIIPGMEMADLISSLDTTATETRKPKQVKEPKVEKEPVETYSKDEAEKHEEVQELAQIYSTGEIAKLLNVPEWRVHIKLTRTGMGFRQGFRRFVNAEDFEKLKKLFSEKLSNYQTT